MADQEITELTPLTTRVLSDLVPVDHLPGGVTETVKMTLADFLREVATELTIASDTITLTQLNHKLQPQSGTSDNLSTISGTTAGQSGVLYVSDYGTDTITIKHNVGNILCVGGTDISLSHGCVFWYSDGTKVFISGGGGGGGGGSYGSLFPHDEVMLNGKISVTVASNNITVALKTLAGTDPSTSDPVYVRINGTVRSITSTLSRTLAAATNWMNLGSAELATKEVDLFPYLVWDSNSSAVGLTFGRIPYANLISDFSSTSTNEKYCAGYSDFTSTDDVVNIGRFAATLSAGAGYTWSVPTFTNANLKQRPTFESRWLTWAPQWSGLSSMTVTSVTVSHAKYKVRTGNDIEIDVVVSAFTIGGTPSSLVYMTLPFSSSQSDFPLISGGVPITDAGGGDMGYLRCDSTVTRAAWAKRTSGNYSAGAGTFLAAHGEYSM